MSHQPCTEDSDFSTLSNVNLDSPKGLVESYRVTDSALATPKAVLRWEYVMTLTQELASSLRTTVSEDNSASHSFSTPTPPTAILVLTSLFHSKIYQDGVHATFVLPLPSFEYTIHQIKKNKYSSSQ